MLVFVVVALTPLSLFTAARQALNMGPVAVDACGLRVDGLVGIGLGPLANLHVLSGDCLMTAASISKLANSPEELHHLLSKAKSSAVTGNRCGARNGYPVVGLRPVPVASPPRYHALRGGPRFLSGRRRGRLGAPLTGLMKLLLRVVSWSQRARSWDEYGMNWARGK